VDKTALIGIGNIMFCDDGAGVYAADYIKRNFTTPPNLDIVDGGTLGFGMMTYFQEYEKVFILSTTAKGKSGDVFCFGKDDVIEQGKIRQSANEAEVVQMLEICSILDRDMADVNIVAIRPDDILSVENSLSAIVKNSFFTYIDEMIGLLKKNDLNLQPKKVPVSLDMIIDSFANPVQLR